MSDEIKKEIVVMELPVADNKRLLFFVHKDIYSHQDLTENGLGGEFYYYNSGTCPINWLSDVAQIALIDETGEIEMDPHYVFRYAYSEHNVKISQDCMDRDGDLHSIAFQYLEKEKEVKEFLSVIEGAGPHNTILGLWEKIMYSREHLAILSKLKYENDEIFLLELTNKGYSLYYNAITITVDSPGDKIMERIKFLVEFKILDSCHF